MSGSRIVCVLSLWVTVQNWNPECCLSCELAWWIRWNCLKKLPPLSVGSSSPADLGGCVCACETSILWDAPVQTWGEEQSGQSTGFHWQVRGQRSVAVVELAAFHGTIKAFPAGMFTWQPWQTVNTKATVKTYSRSLIYALLRSRNSLTAARNPWEWDAWALGCRAYELFYT